MPSMAAAAAERCRQPGRFIVIGDTGVREARGPVADAKRLLSITRQRPGIASQHWLLRL
jgi:hypothetical protein